MQVISPSYPPPPLSTFKLNFGGRGLHATSAGQNTHHHPYHSATLGLHSPMMNVEVGRASLHRAHAFQLATVPTIPTCSLSDSCTHLLYLPSPVVPSLRESCPDAGPQLGDGFHFHSQKGVPLPLPWLEDTPAQPCACPPADSVPS